jgi:hypothetical protein
VPRKTCAALFLLAHLVLPGVSSAQLLRPDQVPLADLLEILFVDRELLAIDATGGGQRALRLRLEENLLWKGSQGSVGMAFTNQRILAVAVGSAAWAQESRQLQEVLPDSAWFGDRVIMAVTSRRLIGFTQAGNIIEASLGLREKVLAASVGENVAALVTDRRALGLSPSAGGFFETSIHLEERLESVESGANVTTLTTNRRLLIFRAPTGSWEERRRKLR